MSNCLLLLSFQFVFKCAAMEVFFSWWRQTQSCQSFLKSSWCAFTDDQTVHRDPLTVHWSFCLCVERLWRLWLCVIAFSLYCSRFYLWLWFIVPFMQWSKKVPGLRISTTMFSKNIVTEYLKYFQYPFFPDY